MKSVNPKELDFNDLKLSNRAKNAFGFLLMHEFDIGNYDWSTGTMYGGFNLAGIVEALNAKGKSLLKYHRIGKKSAAEITSEFAKYGLHLTTKCPTCGHTLR